MQTFSTPMMKQYEQIKKNYLDCLLFYRMGDFYELFMEDAHIGAQVLNITLTSRPKGKDGRIPMAGIPYHALDTYLAKLVKAGYKIAICEQLSPPNKKGIVERDVVRIVTPGTVLDENILEKKENNYIVSISINTESFAISVSDLSTGYFATEEFETDNIYKTLQDELSRLKPSECILPDVLYNDSDLLKILKSEKGINTFPFSSWDVFTTDAKEFLRKHFGVKTLESFGIEDKPLALETSAALLGYLQETQKGKILHIKKISSINTHDGMFLDRSSMINLELFSTIREHDTRGTLLSTLDNTRTAMGGRLLKQWIKKPLIHKKHIEERLDGIDALLKNDEVLKILQGQLEHISDVERLLSRLSVHLGNARDLVNLKNALLSILKTKKILKPIHTTLFSQQRKAISSDITKVIQKIETVIVEEPPIGVKEGGLIKNGIHKQLDTLRDTIGKSKQWIIKLEKTEKEKTGIGSLKVRFNKIFGFYIEVSKANLHLIPQNYMRKQTLVNGERFITKELKHHEEIILSSEEKINELEYSIFLSVLEFVLSFTRAIQKAAESIAVLDCIANFAYISQKERYTRPKLLYSGEIRIKQGRHPVVEKLLSDTQFVPNDVSLDNISQTLLLITGPNMAGKSVFIRQVALIVLMAQMGCFVPASSAYVSIVDRIFVRSGASDVITSGLSTFMVEMVETAYILHNATKNSLIIMDEIGRGTSTYDGISIAWAVAEYLVKDIKPPPKTLFATHYHELQELEKQFPKHIKNFHMAVTDEKGTPIFLHSILPGGASHSFGVAVAKLAGVPQTVINRANELMRKMEKRDVKENIQEDVTLPTSMLEHLLIKEFEGIDIGNITPLEALNKLANIKDRIKLFDQKKIASYLENDN